jgi:hypothetical protein
MAAALTISKEMSVDFACEAVRLWRVFIKRLREAHQDELADDAQAVLEKAISESALVVTNDVSSGYGIAPIDWLSDTAPD